MTLICPHTQLYLRLPVAVRSMQTLNADHLRSSRTVPCLNLHQCLNMRRSHSFCSVRELGPMSSSWADFILTF